MRVDVPFESMSRDIPSTGAASARNSQTYKPLPDQPIASQSSNDFLQSINRVPSQEPKQIPSLFLVHVAIVAVQVSFGGGSVIGALGMPETNPVLFALIREGIAGPLLCLIAYIIDRFTQHILAHVCLCTCRTVICK